MTTISRRAKPAVTRRIPRSFPHPMARTAHGPGKVPFDLVVKRPGDKSSVTNPNAVRSVSSDPLEHEACSRLADRRGRLDARATEAYKPEETVDFRVESDDGCSIRRKSSQSGPRGANPRDSESCGLVESLYADGHNHLGGPGHRLGEKVFHRPESTKAGDPRV